MVKSASMHERMDVLKLFKPKVGKQADFKALKKEIKVRSMLPPFSELSNHRPISRI